MSTPYPYPIPNNVGKYNLEAFVKKLRNADGNSPGFAKFFVYILDIANGATPQAPPAKEWVDSYFEPDDGELEDLDIPESDWESLRKCTESSLLISVIAHEEAAKP